MRRLLTLAVSALALTATAAHAAGGAAPRPTAIAPPGTSGVDQYLESVPTARGNRPSGGGTHGTPQVNHRTARQLQRAGSDGRAVLGLTVSAPSAGRSKRRRPVAAGGPAPAATGGVNPAAGRTPAPDVKGSAPVPELAKALTGGSGFGLAVPAAIVATLLLLTAAALRRRHGAQASAADDA